MKISRISVDSFGTWHGLELADLSPGLNVFYGRNEAGKTTLLEFVRSVFYGLNAQRRHYLPPAGEPCGGAVEATTTRGPLRFERYFDARTKDDEGALRVLDRSNRQVDAHALREALFDLDEGVYSRVFAVGLRELQELGALNDASAARMLYETTLGLEGVSLAEVMDALAESRDHLWGPPEAASRMAELVARRNRLQRDLERHGRSGARYAQLCVRQRDLEQELAELAEKQRRLEDEATLVEIASGVQEKWRRRAALRAQATSLRGERAFPSDGAARMEAIKKRYQAARKERQLWKRRGMSVARKLKQIGFNESLWEHAPRIQAIAEQKSYLQGVEESVENLRAEESRLHGEVTGGLEKMGVRGAAVDGESGWLASQSMAPLRQAAQAIQESEKVIRQREEELAIAKAKSHKLGEQIQRALAAHDSSDLQITLEKAGERVAQLRNRRQTDERLSKLHEKHRALSDESRRLAEDRQIPLQTYIFAGFVFALGAGGCLSWLASFWIDDLNDLIPQQGLVGGAGAIVCFAVVWLLSWWEREASEESDKCLQQLDLCEDQIDKLERERKELDAWLPRDGGPLSNRLASAEKELEELERILPLEAEIQAAREAEEIAERRVPQAKADRDAARSAFRAAAQELGLPANLDPDHLHDLNQRRQEVSELQRNLQRRRDELRRRAAEFESALARIDGIISECGFDVDADLDWSEKVDLLASEIREQEGLRKEHRALEQRIAVARGKFDRLGRTILRLTARRRALLHEANARDGKHFRLMAEQAAEADRMTVEAAALDREILDAAASRATEAQLKALLDAETPRQLDADWSRLTDEIDAVEARTKEIHEERGRTSQLIEAATEGDEAARLRYDLNLIEHEIESALEEWQVQTLAGLWFDDLRARYEEKRQPQTLIDGSRYFSRMTTERYERVWTKLAERSLLVDDHEGTTWKVEQLSSGCREQLFLSLRMALVDSYAGSGVHVPVVLDDVLVNFDDARAAAAAKTIVDFAAGERQVFVFTCHAHVMRIFEQLGATVRRLGEVAEAPAPIVVQEPEPVQVEAPEPIVEQPAQEYVPLPVIEAPEPEPVVEAEAPVEPPNQPEEKKRPPNEKPRIEPQPVATPVEAPLPVSEARWWSDEPEPLEAAWSASPRGRRAVAERPRAYLAAVTDYGPVARRELAEAIDDNPDDDWLEESAL